MTDIEGNLSKLREKIDAACARAGRPSESVRLVAVSKKKPAADVEAAWNAGHRIFGENYVQELLKKDEELGRLEGLEWHFIGRLQRNKVKHVVGRAKLIHTVDSVRLAREIEKRAGGMDLTQDILVEVNVGEENQKAGTAEAEVGEILEAVESCPHLRCRGLMAIPPFEDDPEESRPWFRQLWKVREIFGGEKALPELSMGMSADYEVATEEGATIVRVGTAIFGSRY